MHMHIMHNIPRYVYGLTDMIFPCRFMKRSHMASISDDRGEILA